MQNTKCKMQNEEGSILTNRPISYYTEIVYDLQVQKTMTVLLASELRAKERGSVVRDLDLSSDYHQAWVTRTRHHISEEPHLLKN